MTPSTFALRMLATVALTALVSAQSRMRMWGPSVAADTNIYRLQLAQIATAMNGAGVKAISTSGELLVLGTTPGSLPPPPPTGQTYVRVASGASPFAELSNGQLVQWAPFGGGTSPPTLPAGLSWTSFASTLTQAYAVRSDGVIETWGLGVNGYDQVPPLAAGLTYTSVVAGPWDVAALVSDGTLRTWGQNVSGWQSVPALTNGVSYTHLAAGGNHIVSLRSDGQLVAWGSNTFGETVVPPLPPGTTYTQATAGSGYTIAQRSDGQWLLWGRNDFGQCNMPSVPAGTYTHIVGSLGTTAALRTDGRLETWGRHRTPPMLPPGTMLDECDAGSIDALILRSDGTIEPRIDSEAPSPVPALPAGVSYIACATGVDVSFGLGSDGWIRSWGVGLHGEEVVPPLPPGVTYTDVACKSQTAVALRSDGTAIAWGLNDFGQATIPAPPTGTVYTALASGRIHTMLVRSDGWITAAGASGQTLSIPALPPGLRYTKVACSSVMAAAIRSDGSLVAWGNYANIPALPTGVRYVELACGEFHCVARRTDGELAIWGAPFQATPAPPTAPNEGYLRISANLSSTTAALVGTASTYTAIAPGCPGSLPPCELVPDDTPMLGRQFSVTLTNLPMDIGLMVFGWQALGAPASLAALGMPGCAAHITIDGSAVLASTNTPSQATISFLIPSTPALRGVEFFHQALVLDLAAPNPAGLIVSEAVRGQVGG